MPAKENVYKTIARRNENISQVLLGAFPVLNSGIIKRALANKDVKINGKRTKEDVAVNVGDSVEAFVVLPKVVLRIVYEDENIIVIDKPAGIEVVGPQSCEEILNNEYNKVYPIHRIDRNTLGLVVFARTEDAYRELKAIMQDNGMVKHYYAWVYGRFNQNGKKKAYLFKDSKKSLSLIANTYKKGYVPIETEFKVIKTLDDKTLVEAIIHNGKTHQIRAHLSYLGFPIIGDGKYSSNEINKRFNEKTQLLFAYKLKFIINPESKLGYLNNKNITIKNAKFN
ncbi:MAG: RluA family pseudouridine synthase [Clostridia bacterium]|nr:RluA family pseudouridine synthase [Clostridia bacterium]